MLIDVFLTIKTLFDGSCAIPNLSTVKPVYNGHPWDPNKAAVV